MWNVLLKINRNLVYAIPVMLIAGLLFGGLAEPSLVARFKSLVLPLTILMVYPMMVTLNIRHLLNGLQPRVQIAALLINFAVVPFAAFFLGNIWFSDRPYMALGLLLAALLPTSGMTISWTGFARGNIGAAINMTVIGLTLGSLLTPLYVSVLMGTMVEVDFIGVIQQIVFIVFLPMGLGYVTRQALLRRTTMANFKERLAPRFPALSTVGVLGIVFVAMSLKARDILADPGQLLFLFVPLIMLYLLNFTVSTIIGRFCFSRGDGIALVYGTVMRNLSIALAIAINAFGQAGADAALVIALAYVVQVQAAAWYVRLTDTLFGEISASPSTAA